MVRKQDVRRTAVSGVDRPIGLTPACQMKERISLIGRPSAIAHTGARYIAIQHFGLLAIALGTLAMVSMT
jgi:hypothetical protein